MTLENVVTVQDCQIVTLLGLLVCQHCRRHALRWCKASCFGPLMQPNTVNPTVYCCTSETRMFTVMTTTISRLVTDWFETVGLTDPAAADWPKSGYATTPAGMPPIALLQQRMV